MKRKDEEEISENIILSSLGTLEKKVDEIMTAENTILSKLKTSEKRVNEIESYLKDVCKATDFATDDQLFFGLVFSLGLLLIPLPNFDIATLFESFGVTIPTSQSLVSTKILLIALLMLASGARYFVVFAKESKRNIFRVTSVGFLLTAVYLLLMELLLRGLGSILQKVNVTLLYLPPLALSVLAVIIGMFIEKKWVKHYGYNEPHVSLIFALLALTIVVAYDLVIAFSLVIPLSQVAIFVILIVSVFIAVGIWRLSTNILGHLSRRLRKRTN
jgi:hypothetical protein